MSLSTVKFIKTYTQLLAGVCSRLSERVRQDVQQPWLSVLDNFLAVPRAHPSDLDPSTVSYEDRIIVWRELGRRFGIEESTVRQEATVIQRAQTEGLLGCSWLRCPLYGDSDIIGREIMICSRCYAVSYSRSRLSSRGAYPNI